MKTKKFKLEKKMVEEVYDGLKQLLSRAKHLIAFSQDQVPEDQFISNLLILYCNTILAYMLELEKLFMSGGSSYFVSKELIEKLNDYKKLIVSLEDKIHEHPKYSLKAH